MISQNFLQEHARIFTKIYLDKYNLEESHDDNFTQQPIRGYTEGPFDLFHAGHLELFKKGKLLYDELVVGVYNDETTKSYKRAPVIPYQDRLEIIKSCRYVDQVIEDAPLKTTLEFMQENHLHYCIHGFSSWEALHRDYNEPLSSNRVHLVTETNYHTTDIIEKTKITNYNANTKNRPNETFRHILF